jgi:SAM-dependent methyltransferase
MKDEKALRLLVEFSGASSRDTVLDVACGPGIVVCAFAAVVSHATGIDLTPAMIERARILQAEKGLANVTWQIGDIAPLPYADGSFSIVTSRYAFHHLPDPKGALTEMKRVCRGGGKVVLADGVTSDVPDKAEAFNRMERLRDPSHVRSLTLAEMQSIFGEVGLPEPRMSFYKVEAELEKLLQLSFPRQGDAEAVRRMVLDSLDDDGMGMNTRRKNEKIIFSYPIAILVAEKRRE